MFVIGLYGGVASGKSTVAKLFGELGAVVLSADEAVHEAYRQPEVRDAVVERFGPQVYAADGTLDRQALAAKVFADPTARRELEHVVHPFVRNRLYETLSEACERGDAPAAVLDVPLLMTSPFEQEVHVRVFIEASLAERERRAMTERGWQQGEVARRDAAQPSLSERKARSQYVLVNEAGTSEAELRKHVHQVWHAIHGESAEPSG